MVRSHARLIIAGLLAVAPEPVLAWGGVTSVINVPGDHPTIQAAINAALNGEEIVVAPGTYMEPINLLGKQLTLRSSGGPAKTAIDTGIFSFPPTVVTCTSGETAQTVIEGFTIRGGLGTPIFNPVTGLPDIGAGGMLVQGSSPTIRDCVFEHNGWTGGIGGAVFIDGGTPTLTNCRFQDNGDPCFTQGGAVAVADTGQAVVTLLDCSFVGNDALLGGALFSHRASLQVRRGLFRGNRASAGGALHLFATDGIQVEFSNCLFNANLATQECFEQSPRQGGAVCAETLGHGDIRLINSTFVNNRATDVGGAIYTEIDPSGGFVSVINAIVFDNLPEQIESANGFVTVTNSNVEGGFAGDGNLDVDPVFVDADGADDIPATADDDLHVMGGSPVVDRGTTVLLPPDLVDDLDGNRRFVDGNGDGSATIDMGAYEFQGPPCTADISGADGVVGITDLLVLLAAWGTNGPGAAVADPVAVADIADLLALLAGWGRCN